MLPLQGTLAPALVLRLPNCLEANHCRGREPGSIRPQEGGQSLAEIPRAHSLEVKPGDQLLDALGLAQVGRQDRRSELLPLLGTAPVMHPWLLDFDWPDAGSNRPGRQRAVTHHLPMAGVIT